MQVKRGLVPGLLILLAVALPVVAAQEERIGPYVGLSWGQTNFATSTNTIDPSNCGGGIPCNISESSDMWKVFGGFQFGRAFGIEADLRTFGEAEGMLSDRTFKIDGRALDLYARGECLSAPSYRFLSPRNENSTAS